MLPLEEYALCEQSLFLLVPLPTKRKRKSRHKVVAAGVNAL